jgi:chromosome segregation ATPase
MKQAVEDAELAIAVMQRKLADSERARCAAEQEAKATRHSADVACSDLEQKVRTATEDGHLRVKLLEETVERLGKRGEAAAEVARLSAEVSQLRLSEARLRSDTIFAQERADALTRELQSATTALSQYEAGASADAAYRVRGEAAHVGGSVESAAAVLGDADAREAERRSHQDVMEKLVERAEKAEVQLGQAKGEVAALQQQLRTSQGAQARGSSAVVSASKVRSSVKATLRT